MAVDTKAVMDELNHTFTDFRNSLDEERKEREKLGTGTAETNLKLNAMEKRIDELEIKLKRPIMDLNSATYDPDRPEAREAKRRKDIFVKILRGNGPQFLNDEEKQLARENKMLLRDLPAQEVKALSLGDDTLGGFLAPPEYVLDIIKGVQLISPIRQIATVKPTTRRSVQYPVRSGVFAAQWVGEVAQRTETSGLAYSMEEITTYEMYAEVIVSEQDLEDTVFDLAQEIQDNATEQMAKAEGAAFTVGDGLKKPEGFMTASGTAIDLSGNAGTIASAAPGAAGQGDGLVAAAYNLKTAYAQGATWVLNRKSLGLVRRLADSQGRYLWDANYSNNTTGGAGGGTILGIPYLEVPDMPDQGASNYPIALGNFKRGYIIVDRVDIVIKRLNEKYAEQGQIAFIVRKRVGGQLVLPEAVRRYKSNNA